MRRLMLVLLFLAAGLLAAWTLRPSDSAPAEEAAAAYAEAAPFAVVELFTSEGCSSCPPADRLLTELAEEADKNGRRIFPLAFHVTYWNRLGWTDPYSDKAYSDRQYDYAEASGEGRVYTPQMVVNGQASFVGSNEGKARRALRSALDQPATVAVEAEITETEDTAVTVRYAATDAPDGAVLHLALAQRRTQQAVPRGENAGRTLRHANVVRAFQTVEAGSGTATLTLPSGVAASDVMLVAYAQEAGSGAILGAVSTDS